MSKPCCRLSAFLALSAFVAGFAGPACAEPPQGKVKVFILAGQSNMQGKGSVKHLEELVRSEPDKFGHLMKDGKWVERDDVWIYYGDFGSRDRDRKGRLTVGYGNPAGRFGPEVGFGKVVGDAVDEPVLLLKACWGGQSLAVDFRPPSAGKWDKPFAPDDGAAWKPGTTGWAYKQIFNEKHKCLDNLGKTFPELAGRDYEIAGLVWFQGWNDLINADRRKEYSINLAHFIRDIRKDLKTPNLPVVIGVMGQDGEKTNANMLEMRKAQTVVADMPEFKGTVVAVPTAAYWDPTTKYDGGYHYNGSARFYYDAGEAMGRAMLALLKAQEKPKSHTVRKIEGWTVRVDDRLLQPPNVELGVRVLKALEAKLSDINAVIRRDRLEKLHGVTIVFDLSHGKLSPMQYHPSADWLVENGYSRDLAHCVHIPQAAELLAPRQINVQPWCVLHELAHAYHDQVLGFDEARIRAAYERYKKSGHGDSVLLVSGERVRHYALTDHKEFFAEMTEAYFGTNDFSPFNRAELMTAEPEIYKLLLDIWGPVQTERPGAGRARQQAGGTPLSPAKGVIPRPALNKSENGTPLAGLRDVPPDLQSAKVISSPQLTPGAGATVLWYRQPAKTWDEALPVGNGRLGALVFGDPASERIALNEQTIWTGGPYDPSRTGGPEALPEIRRLVLAGKYVDAEDLFGRTMLGKPVDQMKYQPLGNLTLDFPGHAAATDYRRQLDLDTAIAEVSYRVGPVTFHREVFSSPADQVIVVRLTADKPGAISLVARIDGVKNLKSPGGEEHSCESHSPNYLILRGKTGSAAGIGGRVRYEAHVMIMNEGGKLTAEKKCTRVTAADAVTFLVVAATNFKRYDDVSGDPLALVRGYMDRVYGRSYTQIRPDHIAEHQRLFRRVRLNLPETEVSARPTDERLRDHEAGNDPQLAALMFQYGRYMLISSSRPGCQPANLQGIWNVDMDPSWDSKFTTNINLEMNYWPAEAAGLPECVEPLTRMVEELAETGARVAKKHYGARGWVFHQNTDQWRAAAPMDGATWGTFSVGGAWLCKHLWEHYRYTGDKAYLRRIYPLLKGSCQFFLDTLVEYPKHGWLVTCPSTSPENFPASPGNKPFHDKVIDFDLPGTTICAGSTIDMGVLRDLFGACAEAGKILDVDRPFCEQVAQARRRLAPFQVGKRGNLQEWIEDWGDLEEKHRHISHLYALYPSNQISPTATPKLADAARVSLNQRGDTGTGFGMAWKAACWARLWDGEHANRCLTNLVALQTCPNLFSKCFRAPQVDGAFGATAAIAEMLMQSQAGEIHLLPALPKAWADGRFSGLRARGGFEVHAVWAGGRLTSATIRSALGGPCQVRIDGRFLVREGKREVAVERPSPAVIRFDTTRGGTYAVLGN